MRLKGSEDKYAQCIHLSIADGMTGFFFEPRKTDANFTII